MARQVLENGVILPAEYSDDWYDDMTSNLTKLDDVIGSDSEKLSSADVGAAALSNNYNDLDNLPTIPTVNDATLTIQKNGVDVQTFTANASSNVTANITVPTKTSDLTNDSNFVDTSNSAVASGITSAKVTDYDTHIADTDKHVTTADKNRWNNNTYVLRYSSTTLVASSTNSNSLLDNTDNLKVGDKVIDNTGNIYVVTAIDTANSTFTIGTSLIDLAQDSDVVHKTGDESITGTKTFSNGTLIVDNGIGDNVHGEIKLNGTRPVYINADNAEDGLFAATSCGMSIILNDFSKYIHIGGYSTNSSGRRKLIKTTDKAPYLTLGTQEVGTQILVPENDTADSTFSITSTLNYASGASAKSFTVKFRQSDDGSSGVFPLPNNKTDLGLSGNRWKNVYATNYYYGSNNVEFSQKFVTTDTAQTVSGSKTYNDLQIIGYGTQYKGARNAYILPEFAAGYSGLCITTLGFAQTVKIGNFVLDANNKPTLDASKGYIQVATGENNGVNACRLEPKNSTSSSLGTSSNKWNVINGLEPSSLSLPSGNFNDIIDISSYLTYLDGSSANTYTAPANGWISITMSNCSGMQAYITGLWGHQVVRPSVGGVRFLMPILKDKTANILVFGGNIDYARFIPCQGNV